MTTVSIQTGRKDCNKKIARLLTPVLSSLDTTFTNKVDKNVQIVVCTPEQLSLYSDKLVVILSDDINYLHENDNVVSITPIPLTDADFQRLEWKLIGVVDNLADVS